MYPDWSSWLSSSFKAFFKRASGVSSPSSGLQARSTATCGDIGLCFQVIFISTTNCPEEMLPGTWNSSVAILQKQRLHSTVDIDQLNVTALPGGSTGLQSHLCLPTRGDLSVRGSGPCRALFQLSCLSLRPATPFIQARVYFL